MSMPMVPADKMPRYLRMLRAEVVHDGVLTMMRNPNVTTADIDSALALIEREIEYFMRALEQANTCRYEPTEYGDGTLWYTCSECGGHVSANYDAPKYCPHCGRRIEQDVE